MGAYTIHEPFFIIYISARLLALFTDSFLLDDWFTLFFNRVNQLSSKEESVNKASSLAEIYMMKNDS